MPGVAVNESIEIGSQNCAPLAAIDRPWAGINLGQTQPLKISDLHSSCMRQTVCLQLAQEKSGWCRRREKVEVVDRVGCRSLPQAGCTASGVHLQDINRARLQHPVVFLSKAPGEISETVVPWGLAALSVPHLVMPEKKCGLLQVRWWGKSRNNQGRNS